MKEFPELTTLEVDEQGNFKPVLSEAGKAIVQERVSSRFNKDTAMEKIAKDRLRMGNVDFGMNFPLLTMSDFWQFGKIYAGGFKNQKRAFSVAKSLGEDGKIVYEAVKPGKLRNAAKIASKGIAEGPIEEMG